LTSIGTKGKTLKSFNTYKFTELLQHRCRRVKIFVGRQKREETGRNKPTTKYRPMEGSSSLHKNSTRPAADLRTETGPLNGGNRARKGKTKGGRVIQIQQTAAEERKRFLCRVKWKGKRVQAAPLRQLYEYKKRNQESATAKKPKH